MDFDAFVVEHLVREHLATLRAQVEQDRLAVSMAPAGSVRAGLGTLLIRAGAWLLREEDRRGRARVAGAQ